MSRTCWSLIAGVIFAGTTAAQVYKSVGPDGTVTYSSTPPAEGDGVLIKEVPIAPGPPEADRRAAERRVQAVERELIRSAQERQMQAEQGQRGTSEAEKALQQARAALEQAKVQRLEDWQYLAKGGRVLKQSYFDRVLRAEETFRAAEEALRKARSGR